MRLIRTTSLGLLVLSVLMAATEGHAAVSTPAEENESASTVLVEGKWWTRAEIQEEIDQLDDAYYERFNALNTIPEYETHCFLHAATGTRIKKRYCHPVFVENLRKDRVDAFLRATWEESMGGQGMTQMGPAIIPVGQTRKYLKHLIATTLKNPDLLALREQRFKLLRAYEIQVRKSGK